MHQNKANTKHHFLPVLYLRHFANDQEEIDLVSRVDGSARSNQSIHAVANIRGFYSFEDAQGNKNGQLEDLFATEIEAPVVNILHNLSGLFPFCPEGKERSCLAWFMAFSIFGHQKEYAASN